MRSVISGTGVYTPAESISNAELVRAQNAAGARFNREHAEAIAAGRVEARELSTEAFVVKASGVNSRYVLDKAGVLDPGRLRPRLPLRSPAERSLQCEISIAALESALKEARRDPADVDAVLVACSSLQRPYPAVAIEVQAALGAEGFAYDLNVACSSATFGVQAAVDAVAAGHARCVAIVSPEITSGHNNFALRDSHFIFGDACTAVIVEGRESCRARDAFEVLGTQLETHFSNNIRNDFGFLNSSEDGERDPHELLFRQNGRQVFREVCPMVTRHIERHLERHGLAPVDLKRMWLHQANISMNQLIGRSVLGREPRPDEAPVILDEYANTSSAGCVIAFHRYREGLAPGDVGILCSFGAGYSIGSVLLRRA